MAVYLINIVVLVYLEFIKVIFISDKTIFGYFPPNVFVFNLTLNCSFDMKPMLAH